MCKQQFLKHVSSSTPINLFIRPGYSRICSAAEIASAIFEELSNFSQKSPKFLKHITINMQRQGMLDEFIAAAEIAERLEGRAVLKILTKVKGSTSFKLPVFLSDILITVYDNNIIII